jgi:hypothetical protein
MNDYLQHKGETLETINVSTELYKCLSYETCAGLTHKK